MMHLVIRNDTMDRGLFGVRFLFLNKKRSIAPFLITHLVCINSIPICALVMEKFCENRKKIDIVFEKERSYLLVFIEYRMIYLYNTDRIPVCGHACRGIFEIGA